MFHGASHAEFRAKTKRCFGERRKLYNNGKQAVCRALLEEGNIGQLISCRITGRIEVRWLS